MNRDSLIYRLAAIFCLAVSMCFGTAKTVAAAQVAEQTVELRTQPAPFSAAELADLATKSGAGYDAIACGQPPPGPFMDDTFLVVLLITGAVILTVALIAWAVDEDDGPGDGPDDRRPPR